MNNSELKTCWPEKLSSAVFLNLAQKSTGTGCFLSKKETDSLMGIQMFVSLSICYVDEIAVSPQSRRSAEPRKQTKI